MCKTMWPARMLSLLSLSLTGCAAPVRVGIECCDYARPIYFYSAAQVDQTPVLLRRQVLEANKTWEVLCGVWER